MHGCVPTLKWVTQPLNPKIYSWVYLFGYNNFNKFPLLPPGNNKNLHAKPNKIGRWEFHGEQGYYIGPVINHYQCITCYIPKTCQERITDKANVIPRIILIPQA